MRRFILDASAYSMSSLLFITLFTSSGAMMYGVSVYLLGVLNFRESIWLAVGLYLTFVVLGFLNFFKIKSPEVFHIISIISYPMIIPAYFTSFSLLYYSEVGGSVALISHVIIFLITLYYSFMTGLLVETSNYLQERVSGPFLLIHADGNVWRTFGRAGSGAFENTNFDVNYFLYRFRNLVIWGGVIIGVAAYPIAYKTVYVDQISGGVITGHFGISLLLLSIYLIMYRAIGESIIICRLGYDLRHQKI